MVLEFYMFQLYKLHNQIFINIENTKTMSRQMTDMAGIRHYKYNCNILDSKYLDIFFTNY